MPIAYNICKKHQTIVSPKQSHCKTGQNAANGTYVLRVVTSSSGNQGRHRQANIRGARQLKNHGFAWRSSGGQINDFSPPFFPAHPCLRPGPLKVFLSWHGALWFMALKLLRALHQELQRNKDTARCAAIGPRTATRITDGNLDCAFVGSEIVFVVPKIMMPRPPLAPSGAFLLVAILQKVTYSIRFYGQHAI